GFLRVLVLDSLRPWLERNVLAQAIRDVRQMAQGAGVVSFEDVGVQVGLLATSDRGDEVLEVAVTGAAFGLHLRQRRSLVAVLGKILGADDGARFQVEDVTDFFSLVGLRWEAAHLEDQRDAIEVENGDLCVGRLALVPLGADEAPADTEGTPGQRRAGDTPAGDVHLMHPLIAEVAAAEVPEPVPAVMHQVLVIGLLLGRPQPQAEVQLSGGPLGRLEADVATRTAALPSILVAEGPRHQQLAELPRPDRLDNLCPAAPGALLRAVLDNATELAGGLDGDAALVEVVTARLLDVDILAGPARPD